MLPRRLLMVKNSTGLLSVETFLFDFDKDVYGKKVDVEFIHFIRPEMKFEDVEGLKRQIAADSDFARNMFLIG